MSTTTKRVKKDNSNWFVNPPAMKRAKFARKGALQNGLDEDKVLTFKTGAAAVKAAKGLRHEITLLASDEPRDWTTKPNKRRLPCVEVFIGQTKTGARYIGVTGAEAVLGDGELYNCLDIFAENHECYFEFVKSSKGDVGVLTVGRQ